MVDACNDFLAWLKDVLKLDVMWEVYIAEGWASDDAWASILPTDGRYVAPVKLGKEFASLGLEKQAAVLVHEVCHLLHRDCNEPVRLGMWEALGKRSKKDEALYEYQYEMYRIETEKMVDRLERVFSSILPTTEVWTRMLSRRREEAEGGSVRSSG